MPQPENHPRTFLEPVVALLEERFPWLGRSEQEDVSGADTIDQLADLHESLAEQIAQGSTFCVHESIAWGPVEIAYNPDGTAAVCQTGVCAQCDSLCSINYSAGDVEAENGQSRTIG